MCINMLYSLPSVVSVWCNKNIDPSSSNITVPRGYPTLLRERWDLIQRGTDRRSIKIHNTHITQIYVADQLFGGVQNSKFVDCSNQTSPNNADTRPIPVSTMLHDTSADASLLADPMDSSAPSNPNNQSS